MEYDLHSKSKSVTALNTTAVGTETVEGHGIDTLGFESLEYSIISGTNLGGGTFSLSFQEGDSVVDPDAMFLEIVDPTPVPADRILGNTFIFDASKTEDEGTTKRAGVVAKKRFQQVSITGVGTSGTNNFTITSLLSNPLASPVPDSP